LLTCVVANVASVKVIERCGGVLEEVVPGLDGASLRARYRVVTALAP
jgi:predicted acetyltransferase